ncbi:hypothetical protein L1282_001308 [Chryseobacterium sp. HSC-36S06]|nr:hypothetical protein [Chryseobacterium sp. HSC-36S06]
MDIIYYEHPLKKKAADKSAAFTKLLKNLLFN